MRETGGANTAPCGGRERSRSHLDGRGLEASERGAGVGRGWHRGGGGGVGRGWHGRRSVRSAAQLRNSTGAACGPLTGIVVRRRRGRGSGATVGQRSPAPHPAHPVTRRRPGLRRPPPRGPPAAERRHASKRPPAGRPLTRMPCSTRTRSSSSIPKDALRPSRLSALPMAGGGSGAPTLTGPAPPANKTASY